MEIWSMLKSESGSRKCSYPFRPSRSGFRRRTESTRYHCSTCFPEKRLLLLEVCNALLGGLEVCNKSKKCSR
uniref:Uncharacterized protein n=1 Tax=Zea mays TaxID=4577 RepID=B4G1Q9_MAIZE|nr:unknown [Zea mays]